MTFRHSFFRKLQFKKVLLTVFTTLMTVFLRKQNIRTRLQNSCASMLRNMRKRRQQLRTYWRRSKYRSEGEQRLRAVGVASRRFTQLGPFNSGRARTARGALAHSQLVYTLQYVTLAEEFRFTTLCYLLHSLALLLLCPTAGNAFMI